MCIILSVSATELPLSPSVGKAGNFKTQEGNFNNKTRDVSLRTMAQ
jgi:hypothetical protein